MEWRDLGNSGARVGSVGLGTATWGRGTHRSDAREMVAMLRDGGGNLIDIAPSETDPSFLLDAVVDAGHRGGVFLAVRTRAAPSRRETLADLDAALRAMGIGYADLWLLEEWDGGGPWEEVVASLAVAASTGRAMYVGMCPARPWHAALAGAALSVHPDRQGLAALAVPYSLLDTEAAEESARVAGALGASVMAAWPLAGGVLTGKYRYATPPDSRGAGERFGRRMHAYRQPWTRPIVDALCAAADGLGVTPGHIALAWVRDRPGVAAAVVGARTTHQWRAALDSVDVVLPSAIRHVLDEVIAGSRDMGQDDRGE